MKAVISRRLHRYAGGPYEPLAGWRHLAITQRHTMGYFAHQMLWLVDVAYPHVPAVRVVRDNLNIHRMASLYQTFPVAEARRIVKQLEFHHTTKQASWLGPVLSAPQGWRVFVRRVDRGPVKGSQYRRA